MQEVGNDPQLSKLFECLESEITKPEEIAVLMEITPKEVYNLKLKLRRKLDKLDTKYASPLRRKTK